MIEKSDKSSKSKVNVHTRQFTCNLSHLYLIRSQSKVHSHSKNIDYFLHECHQQHKTDN